MRVCRPVLQIVPLFQTKKCHFSQPFSDLACKIHSRFQTSIYVITSSLLRLEQQQKSFLKFHFEFAYLFFSFFYSFGIVTINTFIHSLDSLRKPYPIPDQTGQSVYPFSDRNGTKTIPFWAAHTYMAYIREYPRRKQLKSQCTYCKCLKEYEGHSN